ncbi:MAG: hypothetical protein J0L58_20965, partial [Burkholderiales bacterium]|nr:hypothetical protein [Burkholderiales bacterium]
MPQRRTLICATGLAPLAALAAPIDELGPWLGDWRAVMRHGGEETPFGLHLEADKTRAGKLTVKVSAPVVHVWNAEVGRAVVQGERLVVNDGAWVLSRSRDGVRLLGSTPEFLVPRLRLP